MTRQKNYLNNKNEITKMPVTVGVGTVCFRGSGRKKALKFFLTVSCQMKWQQLVALKKKKKTSFFVRVNLSYTQIGRKKFHCIFLNVIYCPTNWASILHLFLQWLLPEFKLVTHIINEQKIINTIVRIVHVYLRS
jgi:hypothetical protein